MDGADVQKTDLRIKLAQGYLTLRPASLGAGMLFAVFLNTIRFFSDTEINLAAGSLFMFVNAMGIGFMLLGCLMCVFLTIRSRRRKNHSPKRSPDAFRREPRYRAWKKGRGADRLSDTPRRQPRYRLILLLGLAGTAFGMLMLVCIGGGIVFAQPGPVILGCFFGAGMLLLIMLWGNVYSSMNQEDVLFNAACALSLAALVHFLSKMMEMTPLYAVCQYILLAVSACCLFIELKYGGEGTWVQHAGTSEVDADVHGEKQGNLDAGNGGGLSGAISIRSALRLLWMPLVGACLSSFIFGLTWDFIISDEPFRRSDAIQEWKLIVGPLLATLPLILLVVKRPDSSALRMLNRAIYPIAVALILALPVVSVDNQGLNALVEFLKTASFTVITLTVWCNLANASRNNAYASMILVAGGVSLFAASFIVGLNLIYTIGTNGRTMCIVILTVYLALIAISFALDSYAEKTGREKTEGEGSRNYIFRICDKLATEYNLSPREREVLYYVGRGYNHGYTATKLYITESTVRTHVRHIYEKLGIASREELIALIDARDECSDIGASPLRGQ